MGQGWIKLHRKIRSHWIYSEKRQFSRYEAWLDLIMRANFKDNKVMLNDELVDVKKGSFITSKRKLSEIWKWSNTKVDNFLKLLEEDNMISQKSDTRKTVITIVNYSVYHDSDGEKTSPERHESDAEAKRKRTEKNVEECTKNYKELEEEDMREEPFHLFENNICMLGPYNRDSLVSWCDDLGDELVIAAIKLAIKYGARTYKYLEDILREWTRNNITTVEEARIYILEKDRRVKKNNTVPFRQKKVSGYEPSRDAF